MPVANAICERVLGTLRRECLDFAIPFTDTHLRQIFQDWVHHYNAGRPHMTLEPSLPQPPVSLPIPVYSHRHRLPEHRCVATRPILGGLHHEYRLDVEAA